MVIALFLIVMWVLNTNINYANELYKAWPMFLMSSNVLSYKVIKSKV